MIWVYFLLLASILISVGLVLGAWIHSLFVNDDDELERLAIENALLRKNLAQYEQTKAAMVKGVRA